MQHYLTISPAYGFIFRRQMRLHKSKSDTNSVRIKQCSSVLALRVARKPTALNPFLLLEQLENTPKARKREYTQQDREDIRTYKQRAYQGYQTY